MSAVFVGIVSGIAFVVGLMLFEEQNQIIEAGAPYYDEALDETFSLDEVESTRDGAAAVWVPAGVLALVCGATVYYLRTRHGDEVNAPRLRPGSIPVEELLKRHAQEQRISAAQLLESAEGDDDIAGAAKSTPEAIDLTYDDRTALWRQRRLLQEMLPTIVSLMPELEVIEHSAFDELMRRAREVDVLVESLSSGRRANPERTARALVTLDRQLGEGVAAHGELVQAAAVVYAEVLSAGDANDGVQEELRCAQERLHAIAGGLREAGDISRTVLEP